MSDGLNIVGSKRSDNTDREENDFYATDPKAIKDLAKFVNIYWKVWENACWTGNLSKELIELPSVSEVIATDLINRWHWTWWIDFLKEDFDNVDADWIITNPPYKHWKEWIEKSLKLAPNVAMMMKLAFLESSSRYEWFKTSWLKQVLVFSKRLWVYKNNIKTKNSWLVAYAWFVFDNKYTWKPTIDWIK